MKIFLGLLLSLTFAAVGAADEKTANAPASAAWLTGADIAFQRSAELRRPVLINFTGSDWCVWCHRVRDEIFVQKHFLDYAANNLVLLEVDFPRGKKLPAELEKQNDALKEKYAVTGYPTLLLLDANGKELGRLGYMQGGAKTFVRELKHLISTHSAPAPAKSTQ
ncbi:MAG: thioredoxin family protein [Nibricoccus sp.]